MYILLAISSIAGNYDCWISVHRALHSVISKCARYIECVYLMFIFSDSCYNYSFSSDRSNLL